MTDSMIERFWAKVAKVGPDDCWLWTGCSVRNRAGHRYGQFRLHGKMVRAHRVAYEMAAGSIPHGLLVRHTCDTPLCCNPRHLLVGTQKENVADRDERGRSTYVQGSQHGNAKLTESIVREIRDLRARGETLQALAEQYGVSHYCITYATKYGWCHVSNDD